MFTTAGVMVAGAGLADHLALVSRFGLPASHTALGLVLGAMAGLLVQKRLWIAARLLGSRHRARRWAATTARSRCVS